MKKIVIFTVLVIGLFVSLFLLKQYYKPYKIDKQFNLVELHGVFFNKHLGFTSEKYKYKVKVSLVVKRSILGKDEYKGTVIVDNVKYYCNSNSFLEKGGFIWLRFFKNPQYWVNPIKTIAMEFKGDFKYVVLYGEDSVLVGPSETRKHAIETYKKSHNIK